MFAEKKSALICEKEKDGFTQMFADVERRYSQIKHRGAQKKISVNRREINQR
jgi:hypothetical protein